jgi:hypothetical protein
MHNLQVLASVMPGLCHASSDSVDLLSDLWVMHCCGPRINSSGSGFQKDPDPVLSV